VQGRGISEKTSVSPYQWRTEICKLSSVKGKVKVLDTWRWLLTWDMVRPRSPARPSAAGPAWAWPLNWSTRIDHTQDANEVTIRIQKPGSCVKLHAECRVETSIANKDRRGNAVLCWPPSLCMAWTKRRWRSGVHLRRGTLDRLYCLAAPSTLSRPAIALSTVIIPRPVAQGKCFSLHSSE
jgi:hypothetical protein